MLRHALFDIALLAICAFVLFRGSMPERLGAAVALAGTALTIAMASTFPSRFRHIETGVMIVDALTFLAFTWLALRSNRFWPIWVAGLQGATIIMHLTRLMVPEVMPRAYMDAVALWSYPILALLLIGAIRHRRRLKEFGSDPMWK
jgi:hypothetical protein